jgi:hypothetical protein
MAIFCDEEFLAPRPTPKLEETPLSVIRVCLFNTFAATLPISGRSSIRNLCTRHAVMRGTYLSRHYVSLNTIQRNTTYQNLHNWIINISTSQYNLYNKSECIYIPQNIHSTMVKKQNTLQQIQMQLLNTVIYKHLTAQR